MTEITFRAKGSGDPAARLSKLAKAIMPTQDDLLYAAQRQRTRILERTARGVDVDEHPFKPYSEKGPYYHNPNGRLSSSAREKVPDKTQKGAARRFLNKVTTKEERKKDGAPRLSRTKRTVRFESYAAFKKWLGRSVVDLRGAKAPHMLQAIVTKAKDAATVVIGIYGEAAARARGHNDGNEETRLPQRRFFGFSKSDAKAIKADVWARMRARIRG
jgi:phage gpG-like protein